MDKNLGFSDLETLKRLTATAFPNRTDIANLKIRGSYIQAWQVFAQMLSIDESDLAKKLAPLIGLDYAGSLDQVEPVALVSVPYNFCQAHLVLPLRFDGKNLVVATANPFDSNVSERLCFLTDKSIKWVLAAPETLGDAIMLSFSKEASRQAAENGVGQLATGNLNTAINDNAIVKLSRALITKAVQERASDLHIQPYLGSAIVRIRVDGDMRRLATLPDAVASSLIRHIKATGGMESTNTQIPQDGRMSLMVDGRDFDMRLSTLPASRGERLVIRFLDQGRVHRLGKAGFSLAALQTLRRIIARPSGLVVMTGPTGSGKTSTLYGMLAELNRSTVNIITVENPVEYRLAGISQVEVNEKSGRTFAASLRSILRQDPDIILIGEIRDEETAEIAVQAALTGHLVLTTLHTNDALTAIPRLLALGIQPSILADSLAAVASQRLCRKLCPSCRAPLSEPYAPEEKMFHQITHNYPGYRTVGCSECDYTGYKGRLPIVDIVEVSSGLRDAIATGETQLSVLETALEGGLKSLAASGGMSIVSGDTTVKEVFNTVGPGFWPELARHFGTTYSGEGADLYSRSLATTQGILLISKSSKLAADLEPVLEEQSYHLVVAETADIAQETLKRDEEIVFIIAEFEDGITPPEAAEVLRANRLKISWARLPGLILLPPSLADYEDYLRESGMMAPCMPEPVDLAALVRHIRRSQAR